VGRTAVQRFELNLHYVSTNEQSCCRSGDLIVTAAVLRTYSGSDLRSCAGWFLRRDGSGSRLRGGAAGVLVASRLLNPCVDLDLRWSLTFRFC
jgi:hypothetical protein